jgi:hypothetical protein
MLYYHIGYAINRHKILENKFIENLSRGLWLEYPDAKDYSLRNLKSGKALRTNFAGLFGNEYIMECVCRLLLDLS